MGTFEYDPYSGAVEWDEAFEQLVGVGPAEGPRQMADYAERIYPEDLDDTLARATACVEGRLGAYQHDYRMFREDGSVIWVRSHVVPVDVPGEPLKKLVGVCADITESHLAAEARAAAREAERDARLAAATSQRRLELLARVANILDSPPDLVSTMQRVAELAIDVLAEWCAVDLVDEDGRHRVAIAHRDPAMLRLAEEVERRWPTPEDDPTRAEVLRTRQPVHIPEIDEAMLTQGAHDEEHLSILRRFSMSSAAAVAVQDAGKALGVMTLIGTDGRRIGTEDVTLAVELGRRAGSVVERARLFSERERILTALQRALLPPALPTIPGVDVAAAYEAAGAGLAVGGDFYDVVTTGSDRWWVVLGDVQGKGPEAAAATGAIRHVLGTVLHSTDDPAEALQLAQAALQQRDLSDRTASVVLATFIAGDPPLQVRIATAGHPHPLLRPSTPESTPSPVREVGGGGLLIGVDDRIGAQTTEVTLSPGDVLLFYTDGATDAPTGLGGRLGEAGLRRIVATAPPKPGAVVDAVLAAVRCDAARQRDDVALLALGPQRDL